MRRIGNQSPHFRPERWTLYALYARHCVVPLLFGGATYVLFSDQRLCFLDWVKLPWVLDLDGLETKHWPKFGGEVSRLIRNHLPDGLWVYSFTAMMILVWRNELRLAAVMWVFMGLFLALFAEFAQILNLLPGTFDPIDLFIYVCAFAAALYNLLPLCLANKGNLQ